MEQAKEFERISKEKAVNSSFTFSVVDEETGARTEQQKKIAFVKNNRPVNSKKVDGFIALIAANKYDKAFPIIVMEASKLIEAGYTVTDINGKELTKEEAKDYFVILDGQHRSCDAFWAPDNFWDSPASVRITSRFFSFLRIRLYRCAHTFSR